MMLGQGRNNKWIMGKIYGEWEYESGIENEEITHGGNTLHMGQLVKPKLILGPLHRDVNTALCLGHFEFYFNLIKTMQNLQQCRWKTCPQPSSMEGIG